MPKLLQKSILKSSAIAFIIVCSFVLFICISLLVNASISICGMYAVLNMLLFFAESHNLNFSLCSVELPEYIFIAPYSREERIWYSFVHTDSADYGMVNNKWQSGKCDVVCYGKYHLCQYVLQWHVLFLSVENEHGRRYLHNSRKIFGMDIIYRLHRYVTETKR